MSELSFFPSCRADALALTYAKAHLTEETTPEEFTRIYLDAYRRINEELRRIRHEDR